MKFALIRETITPFQPCFYTDHLMDLSLPGLHIRELGRGCSEEIIEKFWVSISGFFKVSNKYLNDIIISKSISLGNANAEIQYIRQIITGSLITGQNSTAYWTAQ